MQPGIQASLFWLRPCRRSACSPAISVFFLLNSQLIPSHEQRPDWRPTPSPAVLGPAASASTTAAAAAADEGLRLQRPRALGCLSLVMTPDWINGACLFALWSADTPHPPQSKHRLGQGGWSHRCGGKSDGRCHGPSAQSRSGFLYHTVHFHPPAPFLAIAACCVALFQ